MTIRFQIGGGLLLMLAALGAPCAMGEPSHNTAHPPPAARTAPRPRAPQRAAPQAAPRVPVQNTVRPAQNGRGPGINVPGGIAQRLLGMTPEQRERVIGKLPPERQAQVRQRLNYLDHLPPEEKQRLLQNVARFESLPPDKQMLVERRMTAFQKLPVERRQMLGREWQALRQMPAAQRQARLSSEDFRNRYTPSEQQILFDLAGNMALNPR